MATRKKQLNLVEAKWLIQDLLNQSASPSPVALIERLVKLQKNYEGNKLRYT